MRDPRAADRVFVTRGGRPKLARCAVLFLDLLGVRAMNRGPLVRVRRDLVILEQAVTQMYRDYMRPDSVWPASFFSDTLVLAAPIEGPADEEAAIVGLVLQAAWLQTTLSMRGFFARGGLSMGWFHIREGLVFGPALVEAYELESRHAIHPRIIVGKDVEATVRAQLVARHGAWGDGRGTRLYCDHDGWTFIDYLDLVLEDVDDLEPRIALHRDTLVERLQEHRSDKRVWEKYRWVAEYHNAFVARELDDIAELRVDPSVMTWQFAAFRP